MTFVLRSQDHSSVLCLIYRLLEWIFNRQSFSCQLLFGFFLFLRFFLILQHFKKGNTCSHLIFLQWVQETMTIQASVFTDGSKVPYMVNLQLQQPFSTAILNQHPQSILWMIAPSFLLNFMLSCLALQHVCWSFDHNFLIISDLPSALLALLPYHLTTFSCFNFIPLLFFITKRTSSSCGSLAMFELTRLLATHLVHCSHWCHLTVRLSSQPMFSHRGNATGTHQARINYLSFFPFLTTCFLGILCSQRRQYLVDLGWDIHYSFPA